MPIRISSWNVVGQGADGFTRAQEFLRISNQQDIHVIAIQEAPKNPQDLQALEATARGLGYAMLSLRDEYPESRPNVANARGTSKGYIVFYDTNSIVVNEGQDLRFIDENQFIHRQGPHSYDPGVMGRPPVGVEMQYRAEPQGEPVNFTFLNWHNEEGEYNQPGIRAFGDLLQRDDVGHVFYAADTNSARGNLAQALPDDVSLIADGKWDSIGSNCSGGPDHINQIIGDFQDLATGELGNPVHAPFGAELALPGEFMEE